MTLTTTTHLNFHGQARAALTFYQTVFGGDLSIASYADFGMPTEVPGADNVVFGQVAGDNGFRIMAYDVPGQSSTRPAGETTRANGVTMTTEKFFVSVQGETVDEVRGFWDKLAVRAIVIESFGPAQWSPAFGMLADRYGVTWILDVAAAH
jgi:PhnB protein